MFLAVIGSKNFHLAINKANSEGMKAGLSNVLCLQDQLKRDVFNS
jgi:hypothetical protein